MNDEVWVSNAPVSEKVSTDVNYVSDSYESDNRSALEIIHKNERGEPLSPDQCKLKYFNTYPTRNGKPLKPLSLIDHPVVNEQAAAILRDVDLGDGGLYPTEIFQYDRKTRVKGEYFNLNIGNQKRAVALAQSNAEVNPYNPDVWHLPSPHTDGDIAVTRNALEGPDIWVDPTLQSSFFVSGRLAEGLRKAGIFDAFCLYRCRVV